MSANEAPPLYEFYFRYKWAPADFAGFQDALVGCVRDAFGAVFGPALIDGGVVAPSGSTRAVTVQPYIAINDDGFLNVQNDITLASVTANSSGNPRKDLIVARPKLVNGTMISRPTSPFDSVPLTILQETEIVVIAGTPAGSPAYPSKAAGDVIIAGLAVANGATSFSSGNIDTTITELISTNSNFSNWIVGKDTHGTAAITGDSSAARAALTLQGGNGHEGLATTGGANAPGAIMTGGSSNADGGQGQGTGSGDGLQGTGGATSGAIGVRGVGGSTNGTGLRGEGVGTGNALRLIKGASTTDAARMDGYINMDDAANPSATTGFTNRLTPMNLVKMWAVLETNGSHGISLIDGFNVDSVSFGAAEGYVTILTQNDPLAANGCILSIQNEQFNRFVLGSHDFANQIDIYVNDSGGGALNAGTNAFRFSVVLLAAQ